MTYNYDSSVFQETSPLSSSVPGIVLSKNIAINAPTAILVWPSVLIISESHFNDSPRTTGVCVKYSGTLSPIKKAKPIINKFLAELRLIN